MKTRKMLVALALTIGLALAGCASAISSSAALEGTSWTLTALKGQPVRPDRPVTIAFENGKTSGTDGCNRYSSTYSVSGSKFTVGKDMVSTMMACPEPIMQQAAAYIAALKEAASYKSDGQTLTLLDKDGKGLATFALQRQTLGGTSWTVTGYNNGKQAVVGVLTGSQITMTFRADGKITGSGGCNSYSATYAVTGKNIKIVPGPATLKACSEPAGVMEQEALFFQALTTVSSFRLEGDHLELRTADGALAVSLARAR